MADKKISELDAVTDVQDTDEYVLARSGASKKITGADLRSEVGGSSAVITDQIVVFRDNDGDDQICDSFANSPIVFTSGVVRQMGTDLVLSEDQKTVSSTAGGGVCFVHLWILYAVADPPAASDGIYLIGAGIPAPSHSPYTQTGSDSWVPMAGITSLDIEPLVHAEAMCGGLDFSAPGAHTQGWYLTPDIPPGTTVAIRRAELTVTRFAPVSDWTT